MNATTQTQQELFDLLNNKNNNNSLMDVIPADAKQLLENPITQSLSVIDWGKANARTNEIIQKHILQHALKNTTIRIYDPEKDEDCPEIETKNNSPGFDLVAVNADGKINRIQCKLRQAQGKNPFSRQTHFETTRRHSEKNSGVSSDSGHVAYSADEFDSVMVSLVHVAENLHKRNNVNDWAFSIIPVTALLDPTKNNLYCLTKIPSQVLKKYEYIINPDEPPKLFT